MTPADEPFEPELPTQEELDALLGHAGASREGNGRRRAGERSSAGEVRWLVVSRRDADVSLLGRLLVENDVDVTVARNPFTALDCLRARDFGVVISDYGLWDRGGSLLFERLARLDRAVDVVFISDRRSRAAEEARRSGARFVLERPLDASETARALGELRSRTPATRRADRSAPCEVRPDPSPSKAVPHGTEPGRWLEFFFESRRALRLSPTAAERWDGFLRRLLGTCAAEAVAVVFRDATGFRIRWAVASGEDSAVESRAAARVFALMSRLPGSSWARRSDRLDAGETSETEGLVLPFAAGGGAWFVAIPRSGTSLSSPPPRMLEELPFLLADLLESGAPTASE